MSLIEDTLTQIEAQIQELVEGSADFVFPGGNLSALIARRLTEAIRKSLQTLPGGHLTADLRLVLLVSPTELDVFEKGRWLRELEAALRSVGLEQNVLFPDGEFLRVEARSQLAAGDLLVVPDEDWISVSTTTDIEWDAKEADRYLAGAFLIVDGTRIFSIDQAVINIGRRLDNHLIIEDSRISRTHAQMRLINGQFVIFDLESRGGTFVNGVQVSRAILHPGDVISLAGVPIVFGQETPTMGETQELSFLE